MMSFTELLVEYIVPNHKTFGNKLEEIEGLEQSFWNNNHPLTHVVDKLNALIPESGPVKEPRKNKHLEKFRKASNVYYDLYNNGLGNRVREFKGLFGEAPSNHRDRVRESLERFRNKGVYYGKHYRPSLYQAAERGMESHVRNAAAEQGISLDKD